MLGKSVALVAILLVALLTSSASAVCSNGVCRNNRAVVINRNFNRGFTQEIIGDQLLTFNRNGQVVNRQFLRGGNRNFNRNFNRSLFFNDFDRGRLSSGVFLSF